MFNIAKSDMNKTMFVLYCYNLYRIDWERRISADRIMDAYKNAMELSLRNVDDFCGVYFESIKTDNAYDCMKYFNDTLFKNYLSDYGYDGSIYVSPLEFANAEFLDKDYMGTILNEKEFKEYDDNYADLKHLICEQREVFELLMYGNNYAWGN